MAKRGPKPTPTKILRLRGSRLADNRHDENMGEYVRPEMPEYLTGLAKTEWERIVPKLENMGLLAEVDQTMLALYCTVFAEWREADSLVESPVIMTTNGNKIQHPAQSIRTNAWERLKKVCAEFGMSPAARTGLAILPKVKKEDDKGRFFTKNKA